MSYRVIQAVAKVVFTTGHHQWYRVSRQKHSTLEFNFRKMHGFRYAKFYEIINYKKNTAHNIGAQIGFITLKGSRWF